MKSYYLTISSKNFKSLTNFLNLFFKSLKVLNINILKKDIQQKNNKKVLTLLKSPHVNKKAQEQFETRYYLKRLEIYSSDTIKLLLFFKKIKNSSFLDIKLRFSYISNNILNNNNFNSIKLVNFNYLNNNLYLNKLKNNKLKNYQKHFPVLNQNFNFYCKNLDANGELNFIKICLDSSVGRAKD